MKKFSAWVLLALFATSQTAALAANSEIITIDGSQPSQTVNLTDTVEHMTYSCYDYQDTCYRTVHDGYDTVCHTEYRQECDTVWRDECNTTYRDDCRTTYRDECHTSPGTCRREQGSDGVWRDVCSSGSTTCNRVPDQECTRVPETSCSRVPDQQCTSIPEQVCNQVERTHQESYACTKTDCHEAGMEKDFDVKGNVTVSLGSVPAGLKLNEKLKVKLSDTNTSLEASQLSDKALLYVKEQQSEEETRPDLGSGSPGEKVVTASFEIRAVNVLDITGAVKGGVKDIAIKGNKLSLTLGKASLPDFLRLGLKLDRDKLFGTKKLFDQKLQKSDYTIAEKGDRLLVTVNLDKLGLPEAIQKGKKYIVSVYASIDSEVTGEQDGETLLNRSALGNDEAKAEKVKLKAQE